MKKLILILSLLAAPLFASADGDYSLSFSGDEAVPLDFAISHQGSSNDDVHAKDIYFGDTRIGERKVANFVLGAGGSPLHVRGIDVDGRFFGWASNCPDVLYPGQECNIRVIYQPWQLGRHFGRLFVWVAHDQITVDLWGRACRR